jgi:2,3-bisphosphoglycerate-independent phosphoglycerate mutase
MKAHLMTATPASKKPMVLCILDGWGYREETESNAIAHAHTPVWDRLWQTVPKAFVETSGLAVGLPDGQMGNSEVGHMNLGAGRVILQNLPRIDHAFAQHAVADLPALQALIADLQKSGKTCHVLGLLSPGGVHSHQSHMAEMVKILDAAGITTAVHGFLDGRDTPPKSAAQFVADFEAAIAACPKSTIATLGGRYFAMDRDKRWDRVEKAYAAIAHAQGERAACATDAINAAYARNETDEFVAPTCIGAYAGMADGDAVIFCNFRADRAREISAALCDPNFDGFDCKARPTTSHAICLTEYSKAHNAYLDVLFPPEEHKNILADVLADHNLTQLRLAETEKYAHVTFFFNGGKEQEAKGEQRILVPSPDVATYDLQPEMSAPAVTTHLVEAIRNGTHDVIIVNYANGDMVGHTGVMDAAIKAAEAVDHCLGQVEAAINAVGGTLLITADHGNAEMMVDPHTGKPHTAHTTGAVPLLMIGGQGQLSDGRLCDIAPTMLDLMGIPQPPEMTGQSMRIAQGATRATA